MHHPKLYVRVHKKHHEWPAPIAVSFAYSTKTEYVLNMIPVGLVNLRKNYILSILINKFIWFLKNYFIGSHFDESSSSHFVDMVRLRSLERHQ
jgi:sterol desaturase/sphingolipid hydroxylase (fatty acid hydroxylase superfamily)